MKYLSKINSASVAAGVVFISMLAHVLYFYLQPDVRLIGIIPDDAFYYIRLAQNRVEYGFWTFDGSAPATGFHFLYAYFLVVLFLVFGNIAWQSLYLFISILASCAIAYSLFRLARVSQQRYGSFSPYWLALPFLSPLLLMQSSNMMESWLTILFASLTIIQVIKTGPIMLPQAIALIALGCLGSLSRSDFGLLPGIIFICAAMQLPRGGLVFFQRSISILFGAVLGVLIGLIQNYLIAGHLTQASAQVKLFWSQLNGHRISQSLSLAKDIAFPFNGSVPLYIFTTIAGIFCLFIIFKYCRLLASRKHIPVELSILVASAFTLTGYILFYKFNSLALMNWYSANLVVPIALLFAGFQFYVVKRQASFFAGIFFAAYCSVGLPSLGVVYWPHQAGMMQSGISLKNFLQEKQSLEKLIQVGAWNAGIVSYFSKSNVINLDGLTNDDVLPFIKEGRLFDYLQKRNINYLVESDTSVNNPWNQALGGYVDDRMDSCVRLLKTMDGDNPRNWAETRVGLYEVAIPCKN